MNKKRVSLTFTKSRLILFFMFKKALFFFFLLGIGPSFAFDFVPVFGPPGQEKSKIQAGYTLQPDQNTSLVSATTPLFQSMTNVLTISALGQTIALDQSLGLPKSPAVPENLYNFQFGLTYANHNANKDERGKFWAVNTTFGSASDKPFADAKNNTLGGTFFYGLPARGTGSWLFLLNYSNNRTIFNNIPIPGFAYTYAPVPTARITFGLPFGFLWWKPSLNWTITSFVLAPWFYQLGSEYQINPHLKAFSSFGITQNPFYRDGRTNRRDQLTYVEKKGLVGLKIPVGSQLEAQIAGGYAFDRLWYEAKKYSDRTENLSSLGSGWMGNFTLNCKF